MKILLLRVENIKKIKVIEVRPDGTMNLVTGKNDQGKSTLIDAISYLFEGKRALPAKLLREGTTHGMILAETETYIIKRTVTEKDSYISVESKDGAEYKSPQALLDKLVGDISFDVMDFAKKKPDEQLAIVTKIAGVDHSEANKTIDTMEESMKVLRREYSTIKAMTDGKVIDPALPDVEEEYADKQKNLDEINAHNKSIEDLVDTIDTKREKIKTAAQSILDTDKRIEDLQEKLKAEKEILAAHQANKKKLDQELASSLEIQSNLKPQDPEPIKLEISNLGATNKKIRDNVDLKTNLAKMKDLEDKGRIIKEKIAALQQKKRDEISAAQMPIDGLTFTDEGVLFDGLPFDEKTQSRSNILKVSLAIGMYLNPTLKVLTSKSGNELDADNLKVVADMIRDKDYQLWMEKVDDTGKVGIHIEDGSVTSIDGVAQEIPSEAVVEEKTTTRKSKAKDDPLLDPFGEPIPTTMTDERLDEIFGGAL